MSPNRGRCPAEAAGKRIRVRLRDGTVQGAAPVNSDSKPGWAAETTDWRLTGSAFDILEWELAA